MSSNGVVRHGRGCSAGAHDIQRFPLPGSQLVFTFGHVSQRHHRSPAVVRFTNHALEFRAIIRSHRLVVATAATASRCQQCTFTQPMFLRTNVVAVRGWMARLEGLVPGGGCGAPG